MKQRFILFTIMLLTLLGGVKFNVLNAQKTITVGDGSSYQTNRIPFSNQVKYSVTQQILTSESLAQANGGTMPSGDITKIALVHQNTSDNMTCGDVKVYIAHTDLTAFSGSSAWVKDLGEALFEGSVSTNTNTGLFEITLKTPFTYNGSSNLLICLDINSKPSVYSGGSFKTNTSVSENVGLYQSNNITNYGPDANKWRSGTRVKYTNQIILTLSSGGNDESQLPTAVTNVSPANNFAYGSNPQELTWTWGDNTTSYKVLVGTTATETDVTNSLGMSDFAEKTADTPNTYNVKGLSPKTVYYWQVISKNDNGETKGPVWKFTTVDATEPGMVTKLAPANGTSLKKDDITLRWQYADDNHTRYKVYLGQSEENMSMVKEGIDGATEFTPTTLESGITYYWRVDVNNAIYTKKDQNVWSFTTLALGKVQGSVFNGDSNISGAVLKLKNGDQTIAETTSVGTGNYAFNDVPVGNYTMTISSDGFEDYIINNIGVEENNTTTINVYMPTIVTGTWDEENGALTENTELIINSQNAKLSKSITVTMLTIKEGMNLTIGNGGSLTVKGAVNNNGSLIIEDGGQIFQNNADIYAKFKMNIKNPSDWTSDNKDGWQFISSPFNAAQISLFTGSSYDLYKYDGTQDLEWINHKSETEFEETFVNGRGYLASYETLTSVELAGYLYNATTFSWDNLTYDADKDLANFHLIGNPFPFDMEWNKLAKNIWSVIEGYAVVLENGNYDYRINGTIPVGDGFFVKTNGTSPSMYYDHKASVSVASRGSESNNSLNITATGNAGEDNVIINFAGKSEGFDKLQNFNDAIATVYVAEDGKNYGIYNCDTDVQEVELSFNANKMGNYTISIEPNGKFQTVTLVDRFTGVETNMSLEDYNFTAMSSDNHNRFVVRFANGQESTDDSHFVYQSGEELILNIQGDVQIVDVLGRVVYSGEANNDINRINVSSFNSGTYMVKVMNGNEVKVEKVVIY